MVSYCEGPQEMFEKFRFWISYFTRPLGLATEEIFEKGIIFIQVLDLTFRGEFLKHMFGNNILLKKHKGWSDTFGPFGHSAVSSP